MIVSLEYVAVIAVSLLVLIAVGAVLLSTWQAREESAKVAGIDLHDAYIAVSPYGIQFNGVIDVRASKTVCITAIDVYDSATRKVATIGDGASEDARLPLCVAGATVFSALEYNVTLTPGTKALVIIRYAIGSPGSGDTGSVAFTVPVYRALG